MVYNSLELTQTDTQHLHLLPGPDTRLQATKEA